MAVVVVLPGQSAVSTPTVATPPAKAHGFLDSYAYPGDGSVVRTGAISVSATQTPGTPVTSQATSDVAGISLFNGEVTADAVSAHAAASADESVAQGNVDGSSVTNLVALGQPVNATPNLRIPLADWGYALTLVQGTDRKAPAGRKGNRSFVAGLEVRLTADHLGVPVGTVIQIGYAEASSISVPAAKPKPLPPLKIGPNTAARDERANVHSNKGINLKVLAHRGPLGLQPKLTAGGYVFPVYSSVSFGNSFGGPRGDVSGGWHHGDDLFGQVGQPILAVADGTLFEVGRIKIGGNRLWLRDKQGNQFYYAHLSAFAAATRNGARVKAGAVVAFMGTTGDAFGTPAHLHFEVHPVSLLFLGYDGAVDPTPYLDAWSRQEDLKFPSIEGWAPAYRGSVEAPEPGAILLGANDISTASGLDPGSFARALRARGTP